MLFHRIMDNTELQLSKIYSPCNTCPMWTSLQVEVVPVQQQEGINECGLFAIAFAMEECLGRKSESAEFDQLLMREHNMTKCLKEEYFTPFPKVTRGTTVLLRPTHIVKHIKLYCICNMPDHYEDKMICCDICNAWFHCSCIKGKCGCVPSAL